MQHLLIARTNGELAGRIRLDPGRAYSIGRSPRCDIGLRPRSISRRHALLVPHAGRWLLLDTGSHLGLRTAEGTVHRVDVGEAGWVGIGPLTLGIDDPRGGRTPRSGAPGLGLAREDDEAMTPLGRFPDHLGATFPAPFPGGGDRTTRRMTRENGFHAASPFEETVMSASGPGLRILGETNAGRATEPMLVVERAGGGLEALYDFGATNFATVGFDPMCGVQLAAAPGLAPLHLVFYREPRAWVAVDAGGGVSAAGKRYVRKRLDGGDPLELGPYRLRLVRPASLANPAALGGDGDARDQGVA